MNVFNCPNKQACVLNVRRVTGVLFCRAVANFYQALSRYCYTSTRSQNTRIRVFQITPRRLQIRHSH